MPALADWFLAGAQRGFRNVYELELQSVPKTDGILEIGIIGSVLKRGDRDVCSSANADIVPVAEKLDHRVLELVVAELAASPNVQLRLNISPDTTMDPDWWASIELLLHGHSGCPNG
jgi:hypothetical protein